MLTKVALLSLVFASGCSRPEPAPTIDRVEMRLSGWTALDVSVNAKGEGEYHLARPFPEGTRGLLSIPPQQFAKVVQRLEPFRRDAVPMTEKSLAQYVEGKACPRGAPLTTDAGAVWVHWMGPSYNGHYLVDLGCDAGRHAARNKKLLAIVGSFPVPQP